MTRIASIVALVVFFVGIVLAGSGKVIKLGYEEPLIDKAIPNAAPVRPLPEPDWSQVTTLVGTFTTLTGFYDYQSNGGSIQYIRVNPATGNIHVTYMLSDDSTATGLDPGRRVAYAFSTNGGTTWNNFNNVRVPSSRRAGFPSIDLGRGSNAGAALIANHNALSSAGNQGTVYVDFPEGTGAFAELAPPTGFNGDEAIWPYVASASDGSVIMAASRSAAATVHYARTPDFVSWSPLTQLTPATQSGGRNPVQSNGTGRVGIVANTSNGTAALGNWWIESTNNGQAWSTPANIFPFRAVGADTFNAYVHADFVYNGNTPSFVFSEYNANLNGQCDIVFWSQPTGFRVVVPYDTLKYKFDPVDQRFHRYNVGWPSIGLSGTRLVVAFQAFQAETDSRAYHYSDIWFTQSADGGLTWTTAENLTNTAFVDERYPSVSKYNASGQANIVWSQKSKSGLYAFPGTADTVRTSQVFFRKTLTDVRPEELTPTTFTLSQNYPNPFNPATKIDYNVAKTGLVTIKVFDVLGREVATLLNEELRPGSYQTVFDGSSLASGVYMYTMTANGFSQSRKMMLVK
jgi:hypothetical protein